MLRPVRGGHTAANSAAVAPEVAAAAVALSLQRPPPPWVRPCVTDSGSASALPVTPARDPRHAGPPQAGPGQSTSAWSCVLERFRERDTYLAASPRGHVQALAADQLRVKVLDCRMGITRAARKG